MKNYVRSGKVRPFTAPAGGVTSGAPVQIGQALAVPVTSALQGETFEGQVCGEFTVPKAPSQAWTVGALVYWDALNGHFTTSAAGNLLAGLATVAVGAGVGETTGQVYLDGAARPDEST